MTMTDISDTGVQHTTDAATRKELFCIIRQKKHRTDVRLKRRAYAATSLARV
jgi:hypothetical protein